MSQGVLEMVVSVAGNPRVGIFDREVPMYTQIGNAVPVRLAEAVGHHFQSILDLADA